MWWKAHSLQAAQLMTTANLVVADYAAAVAAAALALGM
jgi:hypothetical protein